jgi:hypothetical protein
MEAESGIREFLMPNPPNDLLHSPLHQALDDLQDRLVDFGYPKSESYPEKGWEAVKRMERYFLAPENSDLHHLTPGRDVTELTAVFENFRLQFLGAEQDQAYQTYPNPLSRESGGLEIG